jgi:hypothetical protein
MNFNHVSHSPNLSRKPIAGVVGAILWLALLHLEVACAEDAAAFRTRVIQEVLQEVPDLELAKQVVEIRINREFLKTQTPSNPSSKNLPATKSAAEQRVMIRQPVR